MRRRSGLMAVSVMRCSCLNGGWQSPILRQDAAGLEAARILSPSKARALESKAAPGPAAFYRVSGFVLWRFLTLKGHRSGRNLAVQQAPAAPLAVLSLRRITAVGLQCPYLDSEQFKVRSEGGYVSI